MSTYLGQNFLMDSKIKHYIFKQTQKLYNEGNCTSLIEIGPGKGAITKKIHTISDNFIVIEKDDTLIPNLIEKQKNQERNIKHIIHNDVLEINNLEGYDSIPQETLVIGNLPYYITSPILRKFFGTGEQTYQAGFFMMQSEVGQKIQTTAQKKSYLWRILNYAYEIIYNKSVPAKCFKPAPKVKSCLITITPKTELPQITFSTLIDFLDQYAPFSRKTLGAIEKLNHKKGNTTFTIPTPLRSKRLEECTRKDITQLFT